MPKLLIFKDIWIFVIYATDKYENTKHVHIGKKSMRKLCKIWLEPEIEISKSGELTRKEQKKVLEITEKYKTDLINQWKNFILGEKIKIIKIK